MHLGFRQAYVADLDAIRRAAGETPTTSAYARLLHAGLDVWLDAGLTNADQASELARFAAAGRKLTGIVAGLESLADPHLLETFCRTVGSERLIFSLDMKEGVPLVNSSAWQGLSAEQIARIALRVGVRRMIVLDLAKVGMGGGVGTEPLCRVLRCLDGGLQIIAGGGVRSVRDLTSLARAGCDAALVASALHDGRLSPSECAAMR